MRNQDLDKFREIAKIMADAGQEAIKRRDWEPPKIESVGARSCGACGSCGACIISPTPDAEVAAVACITMITD